MVIAVGAGGLITVVNESTGESTVYKSWDDFTKAMATGTAGPRVLDSFGRVENPNPTDAQPLVAPWGS
jgi:hypothetical protein